MIWTVWSVSNHGKQVSSNCLLKMFQFIPVHFHIYIFSFFPSLHGGSLYFGFHQKRSKSGPLLQTDANEAEIVDSDPCYRTSFDSAEKELKLGHWCVTMLELR